KIDPAKLVSARSMSSSSIARDSGVAWAVREPPLLRTFWNDADELAWVMRESRPSNWGNAPFAVLAALPHSSAVSTSQYGPGLGGEGAGLVGDVLGRRRRVGLGGEGVEAGELGERAGRGAGGVAPQQRGLHVPVQAADGALDFTGPEVADDLAGDLLRVPGHG